MRKPATRGCKGVGVKGQDENSAYTSSCCLSFTCGTHAFL